MPAGKRTSRNLTGEDKTTPTGVAHDNSRSDGSDNAGQDLRHRASQRLTSNSGLTMDVIDAMSTQDVQRLFHELQVHQVQTS